MSLTIKIGGMGVKGLGIEMLADKIFLKVASKFEGTVEDFILKWGHSEDYPDMELKWDIHFDDQDSADAFVKAWKQEIKVFNSKTMEFPVSYGDCLEGDEAIIAVFFLHWDCSSNSDLKNFDKITSKAVKLGILSPEEAKNYEGVYEADVIGSLPLCR